MKDEEEISRMLASLKAVDAPEDFEGGVRSRIAKRRDEPSLSRPSLLLVAKFAFPMLLLLVVGGFLVVSDSGTLQVDMVPPVSDEVQYAVVIEESPSDPSAAPNANVNNSTAQAAMNRGNARPLENGRQRDGASRDDQALSQDDTTIFPDGVDPRKARVTNGQPPTGGSISPENVLSMMGISAQCNSTGCLAASVRERSIAAERGIQQGDMITAADGKPINAATKITGRFSVAELEIVRSGRKMTISLARR